MNSFAVRAGKVLGVLFLLIVVLVGYNYLRHIIFWLPTEEVAFESADGTTLRGTLVKPSDEGVFPAVVMLHGSGPENRQGPGYRILTNHVARSGLAVLLYDKRGTGESDGDFDSALYRDFIADAVASVEYLAARDDIDERNIGLQGNSEGGWFTPEIAYTTGKVAFIFNRVGPAFSVRETVAWEVRNDALAAGVAEARVDEVVDLTLRRWNYMVDTANDPSLAEGPERDAINAELKRLIVEIPGADSQLPDALPTYDPGYYEEYAADIGYDQRPFLEALDIPMIFTYGETDINIPTVQSVEYLEAFRSEYDKDIDIVVFDGVGHPMASWTGFMYGGYIPEFMELLGQWYGEQLVR